MSDDPVLVYEVCDPVEKKKHRKNSICHGHCQRSNSVTAIVGTADIEIELKNPNFLKYISKMSSAINKWIVIPKRNVLSLFHQTFCNYSSSKLTYCEYGDPLKVVNKENEEIADPTKDQVLLKMLAAPVNPADINTIQGKYPSKPVLPAVPGSEGVAEIVKVGPDVSSLEVGDRVIPLTNNLGTWRTHLLLSEEYLLKVPKKLGIVEAATLTVNPCTAYRMLRDFSNLKPGDTVIQNGANSACGQNVIQICRSWGIRTVNIVRDRPDLEKLKEYLKNLGATYVLTEDEVRTTDIFKTNKIEKPKLALNCVGGKSALEIMRHLQNSSPLVTYGGMSREPVTVPTSALIFKDIRICGFWMTRWTKEKADSLDRMEMFEELISMMTNNDLQGPCHEMIGFEDYKVAFMNTLNVKGMIGKKYILDFTK